MSNVLVTGGAGYIGSHMCVELLQNGDDVVVIDNLSNSSAASLEAVQRITQRELEFLDCDVTDADALGPLFADHRFDAVVHFAGLKSVGESVGDPIKYYHIIQDENCGPIPDEKTVAIVATADLVANMLNIGLLTSVATDPLGARSTRLLGVDETSLMTIAEKLPELFLSQVELF